MELTKKQIKDYLDNPDHCPNCGSHNLSADSPEIDGTSNWADVKCRDCDSRWQDVYELTQIDNFEKGDL